METLWTQGLVKLRFARCREGVFLEKKRPGYTTIQKMVYRMEEKKAGKAAAEGR